MNQNNNWEKIGEEIKTTVDHAVQNGDFSDLSRTIGSIINDTIETVRESVQAGFRNNGGNVFEQKTRENRNPYSRGQNAHYNGYSTTGNVIREKERSVPAIFAKNTGGKVAGILMTIFGYVGMVGFGIGFLIFVAMIFLGHFMLPGLVTMGGLSVAFLVLGINGSVKLAHHQRFQRYIRCFNHQVYIPLGMIAEKTGKSLSFVMKDIRKMMQKRLFLQAHLDEEEKCLILTDEAYKEYMDAKAEYHAREKQKKEEKQYEEQLPEECRSLIREGEAYIQHIHWSNDQIPGVEISAKLDQMEKVVTRIFDVAKEHPEVAPELGKLMRYYLPTTKKLLDTYRELDHQPVEGENISRTKHEIEDAIDTLNVAFEKLLDDLFVDKAWDISSDISVLNTILAQDGLKDDGMRCS